MKSRILIGAAHERLKELPSESVNCVVTSPPYWGLRAYRGGHGMIGLEQNFDDHLVNLLAVFKEVWRVLRPDGTLWLNYGDAYAGSGKGAGGQGTTSTMQLSNTGSYHKTYRMNLCGFKPKDLMLLPARVAMALQSEGWWLRSEIVWHKPNPMPESATDRPTSSHEKIFLFSKSGKTLYWTHPVHAGTRDKPPADHIFINKFTGNVTRIQPENWKANNEWKRKNLWRGHTYFYDGLAVRTPLADETKRQSFDTMDFKRRDTYKMPDGWETGPGSHGKVHSKGRSKGVRGRSTYGRHTLGDELPPHERRTDKQRGHSRRHEGFNDRWDSMSKEEQQAGGANLRNVWRVATHPYKGAHFATFPSTLITPCILAGSSERGVCAECGAPWDREIIREFLQTGPNRFNLDPSSEWDGFPRGTTAQTAGGWNPTCGCKAEFVPSTVLDPFAGSGTVGLVSQRLGRDSVLIELSREYAEMSAARITADMPLFAEVEVIE